MLHCTIENNYTQERILPEQSDLTFNLLSTDFPDFHDHKNFWEFLILLEGSLSNHVGRTEFEMHPNDIFLLRPNDSHKLRSVGNSPVLYVNFVLTDSLVRSVFSMSGISYDALISRSAPIHWAMLTEKRMDLYKDFLYALKLKDLSLKEQFKRYIMFNLICQLQQNLLPRPDDQPPKIQRLLSCINQEYLQLLNVNSLAQKMGMSRVSLNQLIKSYYQKTAFEFIVEYKMSYARQLLLVSNKPIYEICEMLGYTATAFNKIFKQTYGVPPSVLRRNESMQNVNK